METEHLKHFVNHDVEILVAGVWIEGHMKPIVKGLITLIPFDETAVFYGPTAVKAEVVMAIRQLKRSGQKIVDPVPEVQNVGVIRSSLDQVSAKQRFGGKE
jgi:hypothetical protein